MPYIKQEDRTVYDGPIKTVVETILGEFKLMQRAELLGWFCRRLVMNYTFPNAGFEKDSSFNSAELDADRTNVLRTHAQVLSNSLRQRYMLHHDKYFEAAGELHYVLAAVLWGVMDSSKFEPAKYGFRSMVREMINFIKDEIRRSASINLRLQLMIMGVLSDVTDETYRRKTAAYEDEKMAANGDVAT